MFGKDQKTISTKEFAAKFETDKHQFEFLGMRKIRKPNGTIHWVFSADKLNYFFNQFMSKPYKKELQATMK